MNSIDPALNAAARHIANMSAALIRAARGDTSEILIAFAVADPGLDQWRAMTPDEIIRTILTAVAPERPVESGAVVATPDAAGIETCPVCRLGLTFGPDHLRCRCPAEPGHTWEIHRDDFSRPQPLIDVEAALRGPFSIERALGIAATAFREGFPCHKSAAYRETEDEEGEGGYVFGPGTQTCAGSLIMLVAHGLGSIPLLLLPDEEREAVLARLDMAAPVHKTLDAFLAANERRS